MAYHRERRKLQALFSEKELDEIAGKLKFNSSIKKKNKGDGYYSIDYSDGSSFSHNTQGGAFTISYSTQQSTKRQYEHFLQDNSGNILGNEDIKEMFPSDEITGLTQDKAISQAKDICRKMNLHTSNAHFGDFFNGKFCLRNVFCPEVRQDYCER